MCALRAMASVMKEGITAANYEPGHKLAGSRLTAHKLEAHA